MENNVLEQLEGLMQQEREVLLSGALRDLEHLNARKDTLNDQLGQVDLATDRITVARLRTLAAGNAQLLEAAGRGISLVKERLAERSRVATRLYTYDAQGRRRDCSMSSTDSPRRA